MEKNYRFKYSSVKNIIINPAFVTLLFIVAVAGIVILQAKGDPLALARIGTKFSEGNTNGTEGYDGQFVYFMAKDLNPSRIKKYLDVPAYRYQRVLLPLLAHIISMGNIKIIPWMILIINIVFHTSATWVLGQIFSGWGNNRWYAVVYGCWVGFSLAIRLDLSEPVAFGLIVFAFYTFSKNKPVITWILLGLSLFAKEVTIVFVMAFLITEIYKKRWRKVIGIFLISIIPYAIFQIWLWKQYGQFGIGSGGAMATPFEIIPYMGILRIGKYSVFYLVMMMIVFGPAVILPSIWGIVISIKKWIKNEVNIFSLALFINCLAIMFMPFSTFRETGGLLRYANGLVLSLTLFAAYHRLQKILNYTFFWLIFNIFNFK